MLCVAGLINTGLYSIISINNGVESVLMNMSEAELLGNKDKSLYIGVDKINKRISVVPPSTREIYKEITKYYNPRNEYEFSCNFYNKYNRNCNVDRFSLDVKWDLQSKKAKLHIIVIDRLTKLILLNKVAQTPLDSSYVTRCQLNPYDFVSYSVNWCGVSPCNSFVPNHQITINHRTKSNGVQSYTFFLDINSGTVLHTRTSKDEIASDTLCLKEYF